MTFKREESELPDPTMIETLQTFIELLNLCHETQQEQTVEMELSGSSMGDSILVTFKYKGNQNANKSLN